MFLRQGRRGWLALGLVSVALVVLAIAYVRKPEDRAPAAGHASAVTAPAAAVSSEDLDSLEAIRHDDLNAAVPAPPSLAEVVERCAELLHPDAPSALVLLAGRTVSDPADWPPADWPPADWRTPACGAALDAYFGAAAVAETLLPLVDPLPWRAIFDDPAAKAQALAAPLADPACAVGADDLRPDRKARCSARAMAEVAVFEEACNTVVPFAAPGGRSPPSHVTMADWNPGNHHMQHLGERGRASHLEWIAESSASQEEYWARRRATDEWHLRTKWLEVACLTHITTVRWLNERSEQYGALMARAAGLGDAFALAHARISRARALRLRDHNRELAYLHLALIDSEAALAESRQADDAYWRQRLAPFKESRRRILALAGLECPAPCADEDLRRLEHHPKLGEWKMFCRIQGENCDAFEEWRALEANMAPAFAGDHRAAERHMPYRQKAERIKMAYRLAVESLAAAKGVAIAPLGWMGDPHNAETLDADGVQEARDQAARLIADASPTHP